MILLYTAGIVVGILSALVLNHTAFRGNPIPFVMELPKYRFPSAKSVGQLIWDKAKDFLERAFTIIFVDRHGDCQSKQGARKYVYRALGGKLPCVYAALHAVCCSHCGGEA